MPVCLPTSCGMDQHLLISRILAIDVDYDAAKVARDARKARVAKNEKQRQQNLARAAQAQGPSATPAPVEVRKKQIDRTLAVTRTSTASMGKFDRTLEGEKKLKGVKRKVCYRFLSLTGTPDERTSVV